MYNILIHMAAFPDRFPELLDRVTRGQYVTTALREMNVTHSAMTYFLDKNVDAARQYQRAREAGIEARLDGLGDRLDGNEDPRKLRNLLDYNRWRAAVIAPTKYGEQLKVTHDAAPDLLAAIAEGHARTLRPIRDQRDVVDAEVIEYKESEMLPAPGYAPVTVERRDAADSDPQSQAIENIDPFA